MRWIPLCTAGDMILKVTKDHSTYHPLPQKFEAGTPPTLPGFSDSGQALEYLRELGMENIEKHEHRLIEGLRERAGSIRSLISYLPAEPHPHGGIFSFNLGEIHSHDVGTLLDAQGIAVRTGFHCAMPLMDWLGVPGTVRASVYFYNSEEDLDALCRGIEQAGKVFAR